MDGYKYIVRHWLRCCIETSMTLRPWDVSDIQKCRQTTTDGGDLGISPPLSGLRVNHQACPCVWVWGLRVRLTDNRSKDWQGDHHECSWSLLCMVYHISNAEYPKICSCILRKNLNDIKSVFTFLYYAMQFCILKGEF